MTVIFDVKSADDVERSAGAASSLYYCDQWFDHEQGDPDRDPRERLAKRLDLEAKAMEEEAVELSRLFPEAESRTKDRASVFALYVRRLAWKLRDCIRATRRTTGLRIGWRCGWRWCPSCFRHVQNRAKAKKHLFPSERSRFLTIAGDWSLIDSDGVLSPSCSLRWKVECAREFMKRWDPPGIERCAWRVEFFPVAGVRGQWQKASVQEPIASPRSWWVHVHATMFGPTQEEWPKVRRRFAPSILAGAEKCGIEMPRVHLSPSHDDEDDSIGNALAYMSKGISNGVLERASDGGARYRTEPLERWPSWALREVLFDLRDSHDEFGVLCRRPKSVLLGGGWGFKNARSH